MHHPFIMRRLWVAALAIALAFGFLGSRGLFDPDEGRYTNVALIMLDSGDWISPHRNDDTGHWTKPPLTYWAIAASVATFGPTPWAARLPSALAYLCCVFLCWRSARLLAPGFEAMAALVYMTMLLPSIAGQLVTTDFLVTAFQSLAVYAFIEWRFGEAPAAGRWLVLMWVAFALAFLTKGPPALLALAVIAVFVPLAPSSRPHGWLHVVSGLLLFLALASPWFIAVTAQNPGLLGYFLGTQVVDRVASDNFSRHGEWYGWFEVYAPTLLLGTLPWTGRLWAWARDLPAGVRRWRAPANRLTEAPDLLLALWVLLPLIIFCIARSRLPLYLLPLFVPLSLIVARQCASGAKRVPDTRWLLAWGILLLGLRFGSAFVSDDKDASAWALAIDSRVQEPIREVVFIEDLPRYGLHLYLGAEVETLSLDELDQPAYDPEYDESLAVQLAEGATESGVVYVAKQKIWETVRERIRSHGYQVQVLGAPYHGRIIFLVRPLVKFSVKAAD